MGHIYFIMGVSGSGKWTLISHIKKLQIQNIHIPISYKTRAKRENEINGVDAWFVSKEDFFHQVQAWEFLEYALVHESEYYGTKLSDVLDNGIDKWYMVIKELDINGLEELRKNRPDLDESYTTIFLNIPEKILKERIKKRWVFMNDIEFQKRIQSSIVEEEKAKKMCNFMIDATKSETEVLQEVLSIINK